MWEILFSTHHTDVGLLYIYLSLVAFIIGGALAISIRTELFLPGGGEIIPDPNTFHRIFTVHGTTMLFLWAVPFASGIGNYLIPIMVRRSEEHTSELQSRENLVCRLLLEKKKKNKVK